jgi:hypothetical protein
MCSMENKSRHPLSLLWQGYFCILAMRSNARFLVSENLALHLGQYWTLSLHLLQMLWPLSHVFIGGSIYSMQTGHSSTHNSSSPRGRKKSSISRTKLQYVNKIWTSSMVNTKWSSSVTSGHIVCCGFQGQRPKAVTSPVLVSYKSRALSSRI